MKLIVGDKCMEMLEAVGEVFPDVKQELIEYLDYYNNRRITAKLKDLLPAIHGQQALSTA